MSTLAFSPEQLHKTIQLKNAHINQLLEELKKTQQLHAQLKKKYLSDQSKLKDKMHELQRIADELRTQNCELVKKFRASICNSEQLEKRYNKCKIEWQRQNQCLRASIERVKVQNMQLRGDKGELEHRLRIQQEQKIKREQEIRNLNIRIEKKEKQLEQSQKRYIAKEDQWKKSNDDMVGQLKSMQLKQSNQNRLALDQLQTRIRDIMIHL